jgi:hypothetical protein
MARIGKRAAQIEKALGLLTEWKNSGTKVRAVVFGGRRSLSFMLNGTVALVDLSGTVLIKGSEAALELHTSRCTLEIVKPQMVGRSATEEARLLARSQVDRALRVEFSTGEHCLLFAVAHPGWLRRAEAE